MQTLFFETPKINMQGQRDPAGASWSGWGHGQTLPRASLWGARERRGGSEGRSLATSALGPAQQPWGLGGGLGGCGSGTSDRRGHGSDVPRILLSHVA